MSAITAITTTTTPTSVKKSRAVIWVGNVDRLREHLALRSDHRRGVREFRSRHHLARHRGGGRGHLGRGLGIECHELLGRERGNGDQRERGDE
jgi:hypothetical protein